MNKIDSFDNTLNSFSLSKQENVNKINIKYTVPSENKITTESKTAGYAAANFDRRDFILFKHSLNTIKNVVEMTIVDADSKAEKILSSKGNLEEFQTKDFGEELLKNNKYGIARLNNSNSKDIQFAIPDELMKLYPGLNISDFHVLEKTSQGKKPLLNENATPIKIVLMNKEETDKTKSVLETALSKYLTAYREVRMARMRDVTAEQSQEKLKEADKELKEQEELFEHRGRAASKSKDVRESIRDRLDVNGVKAKNAAAKAALVKDTVDTNQQINNARQLEAKKDVAHQRKRQEARQAEDRMIEGHHKRDDVKLRNIQEDEGIAPAPRKPEKA